MSRKFIAAFAATAGLAFSASAANATVFEGTWTLAIGNNSDPGHLVIATSALGGGFSKDLATTNPDDVDLFNLWTTESSVGSDDLNGTTLSLTFNFTQPGDNSGPIVFNGTSSGYSYGFLGQFQGGQLVWANGGVAQLEWGNSLPNLIEPGRMTISLNGGTFNEGGLWATDRNCNILGRNCRPWEEALGVSAEFHWDNDPQVSAAVPEPATWALMIGGFGLAGGALRRRRVLAA